MRDEIASSVQFGLVLPRATRAASVFMAVNIRLEEAAAGRLSRSQRVLRYRSRALPTCFGGGAPAGSVGRRADRPRGAAPGTPFRRSPWRSSRRLRRPYSPSLETETSRCQLKALRKVSGFSRWLSRLIRAPLLGLFRGGPTSCRRWLRPDLLNAREVAAGVATVGSALALRAPSPAARIPWPAPPGQLQPLPLFPVIDRARAM
ncbi:hypothetical protein ACVWWO_000404 [Bradyrhizobium sp. F1.13.1]